jgi:hypothetical protein
MQGLDCPRAFYSVVNSQSVLYDSIILLARDTNPTFPPPNPWVCHLVTLTSGHWSDTRSEVIKKILSTPGLFTRPSTDITWCLHHNANLERCYSRNPCQHRRNVCGYGIHGNCTPDTIAALMKFLEYSTVFHQSRMTRVAVCISKQDVFQSNLEYSRSFPTSI